MRAYFYPESIDILGILPNGLLACADFLSDPSVQPITAVYFSLVVEAQEAYKALTYLGYYNPQTDQFVFIGLSIGPSDILYKLGKLTIDWFWPTKKPNPALIDLQLNYISSGGLNPILACEPLTDRETEEVASFFDRHLEVAASEDKLTIRQFHWAKE